eukprot:g12211.t1
MSVNEMFVEIPIVVTASPLAECFLLDWSIMSPLATSQVETLDVENQATSGGSSVSSRPSAASGEAFFEKNVQLLSSALQNLAEEQQKMANYERSAGRKGDDKGKGKGYPRAQPQPLDTMVLSKQIQNYCKAINNYAGDAFSKVYLERRTALAKLVDAGGNGQISAAEFKEGRKWGGKFVCIKEISMTDVLQVSSSKTMGKVETGEVMEALGAVAKDEATGMERVEADAEGSNGRDGRTRRTDGVTGREKGEERSVAVKKVIAFLSTKSAELQQVPNGPLAEAKAEIAKLRPKAQEYAAQIQKLKGKVNNAKKEFAKAEAAERTAHIEAKERREAEAILKEANGQFEAAEEQSNKVTAAAEALLAAAKGEGGAELAKFATPSSVQQEVERLVPEAAAAFQKMKSHIVEESKKIKAGKGPLAEAKKQMLQINTKAETLAVNSACAKISESGAARAAVALRKQVQEKGGDFDVFFTDLAGSGGQISHEALCKCLTSMDADLPAEHAKLICRKIEAGPIGKRAFQGFVQKYYVVLTAIAITTEFEISKAKTIRKADVDEIFEILEGPQSDEKISLTRVRGRSLADSTEGWLSIKGNQGSIFLKETEKPFYSVVGTDEVRMDPDFKVGEGEPVKMLKTGEVLEMLEGPKKETFPPGLRAKGKAMGEDGTAGWFSIRDRQGTVFAEAEGKFYTCVATVAMTDNFDVKDCQVVKKLVVGELFAVEEGPKEAGLTRVKGKTLADDKVGWVTIKGNAGTTYASASKTHYAIVKEVKLQKAMAGNSEVLRTLQPGEAVQVTETKEEATQPSVRVKVKAMDGTSGWITVLSGQVRKWTGIYKCVAATKMQSSCKAEGAEVTARSRCFFDCDTAPGTFECPSHHGTEATGSAATSLPRSTGSRCSHVFGEDLLVPTLEISHYKRWGAKRKVQLQEELDDLLRRQGSASLSSKGRLDTSIASVLSLARDAFRKRLADDAVHGGGFRGFGCGWVFPRMYSHPHYLAFLREDGSSDPPELPFRLQSLLSQIRQQLLPFLEDETLLTPAAFHCDDSFLTLNLESTSGIHGLLDADHAAPRIRRFRYEDGAEPFAESSTTASTSVMNLFVGGYLQSWSAGRWPSLLHSGSNPSEDNLEGEDRLSITIFLGIPELHGFIGDHVHTRGEQEQRVYEWLQKAQHMDDWTCTAARPSHRYGGSGLLPGPCRRVGRSTCGQSTMLGTTAEKPALQKPAYDEALQRQEELKIARIWVGLTKDGLP